MQAGQTYELRARSNDVPHGVSAIDELGLDELVLVPGSPLVRTIQPTAADVGSYFFSCTVECGSGHPFSGRIDVVP
jgi:heme/copper-type cytochrome/quinol oxidase subunit 2